MNPANEMIHQLVKVCGLKGITHAVISPGSRNAPITNELVNHSDIECFSIVDERSAGFFALGIAQQLKRPVILLCTSGTAVLNYSPAIAEAYYQKIPMLIITADRPLELVNLGESQTINQSNIYRNYIKASYNLLQNPATSGEKNYNQRIISEAVNSTNTTHCGPVHINLALDEPLYENKSGNFLQPRVIETEKIEATLSEQQINKLQAAIVRHKKIMVLTGSHSPNDELNKELSVFSELQSVITLTETSSNFYHSDFIKNIDRVLATIQEDESQNYSPTLLITLGDQIISKRIKQFLRSSDIEEHWHLDKSQLHFDTYQSLTKNIPVNPLYFLKMMNEKLENNTSDYKSIWLNKNNLASTRHEQFCRQVEYSDFKIFDLLLKHFPSNTVLQMGNSSPVRYIQLFEQCQQIEYYSNRGTSGIEGCTSTAVGASLINKKLNVLVTGELGFMYDNNGLWNKYLPGNLRIIVVNNGGGGIFRIIEGPENVPSFENYIATEHDLRIELLAKLHQLDYICTEDEESLEKALPAFLKSDSERPKVLEIMTPKNENAGILRNYFTYLKNGK